MPREAYLLAVGKADCSIFVDTTMSVAILVDCPSTGVQAVLDRLAVVGIQHISSALITHQHLDHFDGIVRLVERLPIREIRMNSGRSVSANVLRDVRLRSAIMTLSALDESGKARIRFLEKGAHDVLGGWSLTVLVPSAGRQYGVQMHDDANYASAVIRLEADGFVFIVSGDQNDSGCWKELIAGNAIGCTVFQLPHHGARLQGAAEPDLAAVLSATGAQYFWISADNSATHPHPTTLAELAKLTDTTYVTGTAARPATVSIALHGGPPPPAIPGVILFQTQA